jgi:hypothetical protein
MALHEQTFGYLNPTDEQKEHMAYTRSSFQIFVKDIDPHIPEGPDKTYLMRQLRDCAMWVNIAITRNPDGSPRT